MKTVRKPWLIVVVRGDLAYAFGENARAAVGMVTRPLYVWRRKVVFPAEQVPDSVAYVQSRGELVVVHEKPQEQAPPTRSVTER